MEIELLVSEKNSRKNQFSMSVDGNLSIYIVFLLYN